MKKILYLVQLPPPIHGVSMMNSYVTSSKQINKGFSINILRLHFSDSIHELRRNHLKKIYLTFLHLIRLAVLLMKFNPDIVYFSIIPIGIGFLRDLMFVVILKVSGATLLYHLNNRGIENYTKKWFWCKLYGYAFSNSNIIHVSEVLLKNEIGNLEINNTKTFVVGNTIKPFKIKSSKKSGELIEVVFLSNYLPEKGLMVLLEALLLLKREKFKVFLNAYGASYSKIEDKKYRKFIAENDLKECATINGPVFDKEKYEVLANADIFIFPSYFSEECFPLSLLEAMQAGIPIIATRIGAIPEMIEDGREGLLVEPKNVIQISEKVIQLIFNPDLRKELGKNVLRRFEEEYAYPKFEKKMRRIFTGL